MNNTMTMIGLRMRAASCKLQAASVVLLTLILASCTPYNDETGNQAATLPPCSAQGSIFASLPYANWKTFYHARVSAAVEAHMGKLKDISVQQLQCTADSYAALTPASNELRQIAQMLPAWSGGRDAAVTEADLGTVLLEFLRIYECSNREALQNINGPSSATNVFDFNRQINDRKKAINDELATARPSLERTLTIIGGYDRLRPLTLDIECIKRASLDLRNVLGLTADASACLPRALDTHQSLRDLP